MSKPKNAPRAGASVAYSYIRFSSPQQAEGNSLRRQTERAAAYCAKRGWTLDTTLTLRDLGVSAFRGKNAAVGNFRTFLDAIKTGKVAPGSALIVESIDRISRQGIDEGYDLIKGILKADIRIVTLSPEREFDREATRSLSKGALEIQLILERAAEESERKSDRVGDAWARKRERARRTGEVLTHQLPAWIEERGGKLHLIPARAAVVRRIFRLAAEGRGERLIVGALMREKVAPFKPGKGWSTPYIGYILRDRRALGEFRPHSRGEPEGEPIAGYYPAAVREDEWLAARAGAAQRRGKAGRVSRRVNVFSHLVRNALGGDKYSARLRPPSKGRGNAQRVLVNGEYLAGRGACRSFPFDTFEAAVLSCLKEIDPRDILPSDDQGPDEAAVLAGELAGVEAELAEAAAFMASQGFSATIGKRITEVEARKAKLTADLTDARARATCPAAVAWEEVGSLVDVLDRAPDPQDARLRLRSALRRIVDSIWLQVVTRGHDRLAAVQVRFAGGGQREYLIWHSPPKANGKRRKEGWWRVASVRSPFGPLAGDSPASLGLAPLDLADPEGAARAEELLSLPAEDLEGLFAGAPRHPLP
jgi:DNA invertase Pin-like site-specific DNA recombinase